MKKTYGFHLRNKLIIVVTAACCGFILSSCDKVIIWPGIAKTADPSEISQAYATMNGEVLMDKYTKVAFEYGTTTEYGENIYLKNIATYVLTSSNVSHLLNTLTPGTTYHYRIKLESPEGILYGDDASFTTLKNTVTFNPNVTYGSVSDVDGNTYKTVKIGTQTWMAENLKTTKYNDGTQIGLNPDDRKWLTAEYGSYCWLNNEEAKFKDTYGALYSGYAVYTKKLCPTGWHVPDNNEWKALTTALGGQIDVGYKMKEAGGLHWLHSTSSITNESGFTALPAGYRNFNGLFMPGSTVGFWQGGEAYWWSSTETNYPTTGSFLAFYDNSNALLQGGWNIKMGHSVRCLKDN